MSRTNNNETTTRGGDLATYIENNSVPLTEQNYSDVDALVFAELSYARFEDNSHIAPNMTVSQFATELLGANESTLNPDNAAFLKEVASSDRYANCIITDYAAENDESQWAALTIQMEKGSPNAQVIAMRGTDGTTLGWTEDFELFFDDDGTRAQQLSAEYLKNHAQADRIYMAGHSKGGNDVMSAYMMNEAAIRDKVCRIDNFDGPGVNPSFINSDPEYVIAHQELNDKLYSIYPSDSIIGRLLIDAPGHATYIECQTKGHTELPLLGEHDPFSFQINDQGFVKQKPSLISDYANHFVDESMYSLTNQERQEAVEVLIALGVPALIAKDPTGNPYEMNDVPFKKTKNIYKALEIWNNCSEDQKTAVKKLIITGTNAVYDKAVSDINQAIDYAKKELEQGFQTFANKFAEIANDIQQSILDFGKSVSDSVNDFFEGLKNFAKNYYPGGLFAPNSLAFQTSFHPKTYFCAELSAMKKNCSNLSDMSSEISVYKENVQLIISCLKIPQVIHAMNLIFSSLTQLEQSCDACHDSLAQIIELYSTAEKIVQTQKFNST